MPVPTLPQPTRPGAPGRSGGNACPSPQNSDGFELVFEGFSVEYFLDNDGSTGEWVTSVDGSFAYDSFYHPLGLILERWDVTGPDRIEVPNTREIVGYDGTPQQPPAPSVGVTWTGTETATFGDGTREVYLTQLEVLEGSTETIAGCPYNILPIAISRESTTSDDRFAEVYAYIQEFGIVVYVGFEDAVTPFQTEEPREIRIRADDGFGPVSGAAPAPTAGAQPPAATAPTTPTPKE